MKLNEYNTTWPMLSVAGNSCFAQHTRTSKMVPAISSLIRDARILLCFFKDVLCLEIIIGKGHVLHDRQRPGVFLKNLYHVNSWRDNKR